MVTLVRELPATPAKHPRTQRLTLAPARVLETHARTSFNLATRLLPPEKRRETTILYAFFRALDDIVDTATTPTSKASALDYLADWREWAHQPEAAGLRPGLAVAVDAIFDKHRIPRALIEDFLAGLESDLQLRQIETQAEFLRYCYCVAATVGLTMARVLGARNPAALAAAEQLGVAMQMTNVLRDIGEDLEIGRVYVPRETLVEFGLDRVALVELRGDVERAGATLAPMMRRLIHENRRLYDQALPGILHLPADSQLPILLASRLYRHLLSEIESNNYDAINFRASTSRWDKLRELGISATITRLWQSDASESAVAR